MQLCHNSGNIATGTIDTSDRRAAVTTATDIRWIACCHNSRICGFLATENFRTLIDCKSEKLHLKQLPHNVYELQFLIRSKQQQIYDATELLTKVRRNISTRDTTRPHVT